MAGVRINILCLVAVLIAVSAIFETWLHGRYGTMGWIVNLYGIFEDYSHSSEFWLAAALFIAGTIAALATPLGGVIQVIGVSFFFYAFSSSNDGGFPSDIGPYMGLAAAILVMASLAFPIGVEVTTKPSGVKFTHRPENLLGRLMTVKPGN